MRTKPNYFVAHCLIHVAFLCGGDNSLLAHGLKFYFYPFIKMSIFLDSGYATNKNRTLRKNTISFLCKLFKISNFMLDGTPF